MGVLDPPPALRGNNLADLSSPSVARTNLGLDAAKAVATANVALTGLQVLDAYQTVAGDVVLLVGQTTGSQNGPWVVAAGAWTRPSWFASGSTHRGRGLVVLGGTLNVGTSWTLIVTVEVDTTVQAWVNTPAGALNATYVRRSQISVESVVFDSFNRSDRSTAGDTSDSGHVYTEAGGGQIIANRLSASIAGQPSYNMLDLGAPMRAMSSRFILTAGTGDAGFALINGKKSTFAPLGDDWLHLSITRIGWDLTWTTNAVVGGAITFTRIDSMSFDTPLLRDGTVYGASMEVIGDRAFITVWNVSTGAIVSQRSTPPDSHFVSFLGRYCIWEPVPVSGAAGGSLIDDITASTMVSALDVPAITRGDAVNLIAKGTGDPLGIGYGTTLPPGEVTAAFAFGAANWGWACKLISDGVPNATKIDLYVGTSSGNLCAGVYRFLPATSQVVRIATTGTIACPVSGFASLALLAPVTAFRATDFLALAVDNVTATFVGNNAGARFPGKFQRGLLTGAVPLPAGPLGALWYGKGPTPDMVLTA